MQYMNEETLEKINEVKLKHRSSLKLEDWQRDGYYAKQDQICDRILRGEDPDFKDTIERIHVDDISVEEFIERYEKGSRPVIVQGVVDSWPALH